MLFVTTDDYEPYSNMIIKYVTEGCGPDVEFKRFSNGEDFFEWFNSTDEFVDLIFQDVEMGWGRMTGEDVAETLRGNERVGKLVFVTSYPRLHIRFDDRIAGLIRKPFTKDDIVDFVNENVY